MTFLGCTQGFFNKAESVKIRLAIMWNHHNWLLQRKFKAPRFSKIGLRKGENFFFNTIQNLKSIFWTFLLLDFRKHFFGTVFWSFSLPYSLSYLKQCIIYSSPGWRIGGFTVINRMKVSYLRKEMKLWNVKNQINNLFRERTTQIWKCLVQGF